MVLGWVNECTVTRAISPIHQTTKLLRFLCLRNAKALRTTIVEVKASTGAHSFNWRMYDYTRETVEFLYGSTPTFHRSHPPLFATL